jgi:hypothetical protein
MIQVEGPPPEVVTLGRTNNFDAATYSGTGNWLPTPDSEYIEDITKSDRMRYSSTFGGGSFEFAPDPGSTFNGTGFGTTAGSEESLNNLSIEAWYFRVPAAGGISIRSFDNSNAFTPSWELSDTCVVSDNGDPVTETENLSINQYLVPGTWNQVVMTFGGGTYVKAYVNGALVATSASVSPVAPYQCTGPTTISAQDGHIAIIRAYDRIITDAEVLQNYNAVKSRFTYTLPASIVTTGLVTYLDAAPSGVSPTKYGGVGYDNSEVWRDQVGTVDITLFGAPAYDSSTSGGQLTFDSTATEYGTGSLVNTDDMTVEIWYKPTTTAASTIVSIISSHVDASNIPWSIRNISSGTPNYNRIGCLTRLSGGNYSTGVNPQNLTSGTWYQITFTKVGDAGGYMVRSIKSTTALTSWAQDYPYPTSADTTELYLMRDAGSVLRRRGTIGLVRIYNTALTNAELLQNYNATKARFGLA